MLKWYNDLYLGKKVLKYDIDTIKKKVEETDTFFRVYLITLSTNPENQFDIVDLHMLKQKWVYEELPLIVGVAGNKSEVNEVLIQILRDCIKIDGDYNMRKFITDNCKGD